tara:strand:+ start:1767 stop:2048 length:282 start_codon:yes stop_codon:yes gene_type:complete
MIPYVIKGQNWKKEVEIDESIFETDYSAIMEAATRLIENHKDFDEPDTMGVFLEGYKKSDGYHGDSHCFLKTSEVLRNASLFDSADFVEKLYK